MIPKAIQSHAKKHGMKVVELKDRDIASYQKNGRDLITFSISDATRNTDELLEQLDKRIAASKGGK